MDTAFDLQCDIYLYYLWLNSVTSQNKIFHRTTEGTEPRTSGPIWTMDTAWHIPKFEFWSSMICESENSPYINSFFTSSYTKYKKALT